MEMQVWCFSFKNLFCFDHTSLLIVVFHPHGLNQLLGIPADELIDEIIDLPTMFGAAGAEITDRLFECTHLPDRIQLIESFLMGITKNNAAKSQQVVMATIDYIINCSGLTSVNQLISFTGYTSKSIDRKFMEIVGIPPKRFSNIIKQNIYLKGLRDRPNDKLTDLAYSVGYYDHSHAFKATTLLGAQVLFMPHVTMCTPSPRPGAGFVDPALWYNRKNDPESLRAEFDGLKGRKWLMKWLPTRAYDNGIYCVFSNPIGMDDDQLKNGCSMIIDPFGDIIAECRALDNEIVIGTTSSDKIVNAGGSRYINARRPDLYAPIIGKPHQPDQKVSWLMVKPQIRLHSCHNKIQQKTIM